MLGNVGGNGGRDHVRAGLCHFLLQFFYPLVLDDGHNGGAARSERLADGIQPFIGKSRITQLGSQPADGGSRGPREQGARAQHGAKNRADGAAHCSTLAPAPVSKFLDVELVFCVAADHGSILDADQARPPGQFQFLENLICAIFFLKRGNYNLNRNL